MTIRLVVNADDAGVDSARNRGILRSARDGIVTSATVLAGSPAAEEFLEEARRAHTLTGAPLGIGLHLNLSQGRPLASGVPSLLGADGAFHAKHDLWRRALAGSIDARDAARELEAQRAWLAARGVAPDHIDGHHHAHVLPGVAEALASAVPGGSWVRLPREGVPAPAALARSPEEVFASRATLSGALGELSRRAAAMWRGRLRFPEAFLGLGLIGGYGAGDLIAAIEASIARREAALSRRPGPLWELMVHPGEVDEGSVAFSREPARSREVEALTDASLRSFLARAGVALVSFGALP